MMHFGLNILIMLSLLIGSVAEPIRVYQGLSGRLGASSGLPPEKIASARRLFYLALPFWVGMIWGAINVEWLHRCNGDTCIGYMLPAIPFPFLYGIAEIKLQLARYQASR